MENKRKGIEVIEFNPFTTERQVKVFKSYDKALQYINNRRRELTKDWTFVIFDNEIGAALTLFNEDSKEREYKRVSMQLYRDKQIKQHQQ